MFGGGPRTCVGQHFSMLESVIILAALLRDFEFRAVTAAVPVDVQVTMRARVPVLTELRPV
ncbi:MAG TPA: cytochrome P450 [Micromonosporaceae bacterium]